MNITVNKQKLLLEYLLSSQDIFAICNGIIKSKYFAPELRQTIHFIQNYYSNYNNLPSPCQVEAETDQVLQQHELTQDKTDYCIDEIEQFCKRKAIEMAVLASPPLIEKGDYGAVELLIKDAILISLNRDLGIDVCDDPEKKLRELAITTVPISTGWPNIDKQLFGGVYRKNMILFSGDSGGGKSLTLANLAQNFMIQNLNVLYISLELPEEMIFLRYGSIMSGLSQENWKQHIPEMATGMLKYKNKGRLFIKRLPAGSNANDVRAYLKEFELVVGVRPDAIILDYLDEAGTVEPTPSDNLGIKDSVAASEMYEIGVEYNAIFATASQHGRHAADAKVLTQSHIAGGMGKIRKADIHIGLRMTPPMMAAGTMAMIFLKTRSSNGVGKTEFMNFDPISLRITSGANNANAMRFQNEMQQTTENNHHHERSTISPNRSMFNAPAARSSSIFDLIRKNVD